jgi:hypothetical protein
VRARLRARRGLTAATLLALAGLPVIQVDDFCKVTAAFLDQAWADVQTNFANGKYDFVSPPLSRCCCYFCCRRGFGLGPRSRSALVRQARTLAPYWLVQVFKAAGRW